MFVLSFVSLFAESNNYAKVRHLTCFRFKMHQLGNLSLFAWLIQIFLIFFFKDSTVVIKSLPGRMKETTEMWEREQLSGQSAGLMMKRSPFRGPAETAGEPSSPESTLCVFISVSVPASVLPQQHVKDPGHSAQSAGDGLLVITYAPYVYMCLCVK